jgi:hypothetical protein
MTSALRFLDDEALAWENAVVVFCCPVAVEIVFVRVVYDILIAWLPRVVVSEQLREIACSYDAIECAKAQITDMASLLYFGAVVACG